MNAETKVEVPTLAKLREPFPDHQVSKLPKETGAQAKQRKADMDSGKWPPKCDVCNGFHHPKAVHLDYVGHAALTDRLLDVDPEWTWEPMGTTPEGLPAINGGLWIKLTVCGVSRYGFGAADGKQGGDAIKEMIGDALRNAAMRFGAALDLWHKGDLHVDGDDAGTTAQTGALIDDAQRAALTQMIEAKRADTQKLCNHYGVGSLNDIPAARFDEVMAALKKKPDPKPSANPQRSEELADEIPY